MYQNHYALFSGSSHKIQSQKKSWRRDWSGFQSNYKLSTHSFNLLIYITIWPHLFVKIFLGITITLQQNESH